MSLTGSQLAALLELASEKGYVTLTEIMMLEEAEASISLDDETQSFGGESDQ